MNCGIEIWVYAIWFLCSYLAPARDCTCDLYVWEYIKGETITFVDLRWFDNEFCHILLIIFVTFHLIGSRTRYLFIINFLKHSKICLSGVASFAETMADRAGVTTKTIHDDLCSNWWSTRWNWTWCSALWLWSDFDETWNRSWWNCQLRHWFVHTCWNQRLLKRDDLIIWTSKTNSIQGWLLGYNRWAGICNQASVVESNRRSTISYFAWEANQDGIVLLTAYNFDFRWFVEFDGSTRLGPSNCNFVRIVWLISSDFLLQEISVYIHNK